MKLLVIADTDNWAFANRANALRQHAPDDWTVDVVMYTACPVEQIAYGRYDCVFSLPTNLTPKLGFIWNRLELEIPLVVSHNSGLGRRRNHLTEAMLIADYVVVNNHAAWANMVEMVRPDRANVCNISNGVDMATFRPVVPIKSREHRVLWIGSRPKVDGKEGDIKRYHEILEPLSQLLSNVGNGWSADFRIVDPGEGLNPQQMAEWYNTGSYIVCSSRNEGTPNIILEGAACGCVPVSLAVGNVPELVTNGASGVIVTRPHAGAFWEALQHAREEREMMSSMVNVELLANGWDWSKRSQHFFWLFDKLVAGERPRPFTWLT